MKKIFFCAALFTAPVFANPYIGIEYGLVHADHDFEPAVNGKQLNPEPEDGVLGGYLGYKFNQNWGLELGYRQFDMDDSKGNETIASGIETEQDWDADIKAKQFTLMPMYFHNFSDKWTMKVGAGVSYTQYDYSSGYSTEEEVIATDVDQNYSYTQGESGSSNEFGGIVSLGIDYNIMAGWAVGANAKYQVDSYANAATFNITTAYYF